MADPVTERILGAAFEVHRELGPGLLEKTYELCLSHELQLRGAKALRQFGVPLRYKDIQLGVGYRVDLLVDDCVIVEIKTVDRLLPVHTAQLLTYLKLSKRRVGLLLNFNAIPLRDGIKRVVNNYL
ncbi:MAG: GxxExxY protein [Rhodospirillales bacterium]|nr:GxxExxY protein [Rhodospirillales bacterium]